MDESAPEIDLSLCGQEPIHIPGSIQQHGFLIALDISSQIIAQASDNLAAFTGQNATDVIGRPLSAIFDQDAISAIAQELANAAYYQKPTYVGAVSISPHGYFDVLLHHHDELAILEFELSARNASADFRLVHSLVGNFFITLSDADSVQALAQYACDEIQKLTGFGRVLAYQFDGNDHGHVFAEARDPSYTSYLNHRFPGADVPPQARALYVKNRIRIIPDADYTSSRLLPALNPNTNLPTDLTYSALRSVSPVHLQYMRNMGTWSSMSISIVIKGKLWGLISCHNKEPKFVPFEIRAVCEQLVNILALRIESKEEIDEYNYKLALRRILVSLLAQLSKGPEFIDNMQIASSQLLQFADAKGAALIFENRLVTFGTTPSEDNIQKMAEWLNNTNSSDCFHSDNLSEEYPLAAEFRDTASGLLALPLSRFNRSYLMWFRPEKVQTIDWAGNPHLKAMQQSPTGKLSPRMSFETWREEVHGLSTPWRLSEIETALEFRSALLEIVLERTEAIALLADELTRTNKELEAFSYSVSHDLRAPLRHIVGYTDLLLEMQELETGTRQERYLKNIKESARFAGKLVDDLLSFSQMGRAALYPSSINLKELIKTCITKLKNDIGERKIDWQIGQLPIVSADPMFLELAIYNLLSNAVKYTSPRELAVIKINAEENETEHVISIADNGVGFNNEFVHKLFGVFQRLHRMEDFQGTGIGLANVRRIIERHDGRAWAEGKLGEGASFYFTLPKLSLLSR